MKKVWKLKELDCANCAAKMEAAIAKLDGVEHVSVNFMTQRLTLEAAEGAMEALVPQIQKTIRKVEPDCTLVL